MNMPTRPVNDFSPPPAAGGVPLPLPPGAPSGGGNQPAPGAQVVELARRLSERYGPLAGPVDGLAGGPVRQALQRMAQVHRRTADEGLRKAVAADGNRLLEAARRAGFLRTGHSDFQALAAAIRPGPAPGTMDPTGQPGTERPTTAPAAGSRAFAGDGYRIVEPLASRVGPFDNRGTLFAGARLRQGAGEPPVSWNGLPKAPYTEFGAGVATSAGTPFDPRSAEQVTRALAPRYQAYVDRGTPVDRFRAAVSVDAATLDPGGRRSAELQLTGVRRWPNGSTTRGALQIGTPPPVPGAGPAVDALVEHRVPVPAMGRDAVLRLGARLTRPGPAGAQTVSVTAGLPAPDRGTFPKTPRPVLDTSVTWQQAPGRSSTTAMVRAGWAAPATVATVTLTHRDAHPASGSTTSLQFFAQQRLQGGAGDPNTSTSNAGINPRRVPTGRFPEGATEPITTLYADGNVTLRSSAPAMPGDGPGRDTVRVGIVRNSPTGAVPTLYGEAYGDVTPYANGREPKHGRLGGEIGIHWRPAPDQPMTVHAALRAGAPGPQDAHGGTAAELGVDVEVARDTFVGGHVRQYLDGQGTEVYLGLERRF
jgi:hypothetical protein